MGIPFFAGAYAVELFQGLPLFAAPAKEGDLIAGAQAVVFGEDGFPVTGMSAVAVESSANLVGKVQLGGASAESLLGAGKAVPSLRIPFSEVFAGVPAIPIPRGYPLFQVVHEGSCAPSVESMWWGVYKCRTDVSTEGDRL
jgi:hypothetical protein